MLKLIKGGNGRSRPKTKYVHTSPPYAFEQEVAKKQQGLKVKTTHYNNPLATSGPITSPKRAYYLNPKDRSKPALVTKYIQEIARILKPNGKIEYTSAVAFVIRKDIHAPYDFPVNKKGFRYGSYIHKKADSAQLKALEDAHKGALTLIQRECPSYKPEYFLYPTHGKPLFFEAKDLSLEAIHLEEISGAPHFEETTLKVWNPKTKQDEMIKGILVHPFLSFEEMKSIYKQILEPYFKDIDINFEYLDHEKALVHLYIRAKKK